MSSEQQIMVCSGKNDRSVRVTAMGLVVVVSGSSGDSSVETSQDISKNHSRLGTGNFLTATSAPLANDFEKFTLGRRRLGGNGNSASCRTSAGSI